MSDFGTFRTLPIWLTVSVLWEQSGHHNCAGHHPTPACSPMKLALAPALDGAFSVKARDRQHARSHRDELIRLSGQ
jgi:hypothetical protein